MLNSLDNGVEIGLLRSISFCDVGGWYYSYDVIFLLVFNVQRLQFTPQNGIEVFSDFFCSHSFLYITGPCSQLKLKKLCLEFSCHDCFKIISSIILILLKKYVTHKQQVSFCCSQPLIGVCRYKRLTLRVGCCVFIRTSHAY